MRLISWNTNGLRATLKNDDLTWLKKYKPDFLALQETKLQESQIPKEIYDLGFKDITFNCAERAGYSGVMTLSKMKFETYKGRFFEDSEGRVLEHNYGDVAIFNIYFPNGQKDDLRLAYKMDFYAAFLTYLLDLRKAGKKIIICGDVNTAHEEIDLTHPKANSKTSGFLEIERAWISELLKHGFIDTFRFLHPEEVKYSWWSYRARARERNVGWRIDYFFISEDLKENLEAAFILNDIYGSDHCPVGIDINL